MDRKPGLGVFAELETRISMRFPTFLNFLGFWGREQAPTRRIEINIASKRETTKYAFGIAILYFLGYNGLMGIIVAFLNVREK